MIVTAGAPSLSGWLITSNYPTAGYFDTVLAAVPTLAASGLVLRTAIAATGPGTGLLAVPLVPAGFLTASALIARELFFGPVVTRSEQRRG